MITIIIITVFLIILKKDKTPKPTILEPPFKPVYKMPKLF